MIISCRETPHSDAHMNAVHCFHPHLLSSIPTVIVRHRPPIKPNCCPLHQLAELPVTLATRPGSCPAPLAQMKSCHFLIDSGLSFCLCSRFPIWQQSPLFSAKAHEKRKRMNTLALALRENLRFKQVKQKQYSSTMAGLCLVGLLILRRGKAHRLIEVC